MGVYGWSKAGRNVSRGFSCFHTAKIMTQQATILLQLEQNVAVYAFCSCVPKCEIYLTHLSPDITVELRGSPCLTQADRAKSQHNSLIRDAK